MAPSTVASGRLGLGARVRRGPPRRLTHKDTEAEQAWAGACPRNTSSWQHRPTFRTRLSASRERERQDTTRSNFYQTASPIYLDEETKREGVWQPLLEVQSRTLRSIIVRRILETQSRRAEKRSQHPPTTTPTTRRPSRHRGEAHARSGDSGGETGLGLPDCGTAWKENARKCWACGKKPTTQQEHETKARDSQIVSIDVNKGCGVGDPVSAEGGHCGLASFEEGVLEVNYNEVRNPVMKTTRAANLAKTKQCIMTHGGSSTRGQQEDVGRGQPHDGHLPDHPSEHEGVARGPQAHMEQGYFSPMTKHP